jgi:hypothetical protein
MTLVHQWVIITQMKSLFAWTSYISGGTTLWWKILPTPMPRRARCPGAGRHHHNLPLCLGRLAGRQRNIHRAAPELADTSATSHAPGLPPALHPRRGPRCPEAGSLGSIISPRAPHCPGAISNPKSMHKKTKMCINLYSIL